MKIIGAYVLGLFSLLIGGRVADAAPTVVTLSFDDTLADQAQLVDLLAARGLHATFFVNSPRIDQPNYMTAAQIMALQDAGNEIAGHTEQHLILTGMAVDEQRRQICNDRVALLARGFQVTSFAYPHGASDLATHSLVTDCGYNSARDASSLRSHDPETCTSCAYAETMPPRDMLSIRTPVSIKSTVTLADLQLNVTEAEANGGGWVPFVFHHVCDGCNPLAISPAVLIPFLDWLAARAASGTMVKTFQEVVGGPLNPGVDGPIAAPYLAADGNMLRNGSLEADADGDLVPDCWQIGSGGSDPTTYTSGAAPAAHGGSFAELLTVGTGLMSSPRVLSFQDLGECSPAVTPGSTFKLSAWYQASDATVLIAYYRNSNGWWKYWSQSPLLSASTTFALAEWTTPPAPADATAISVGMAIATVGTLAVDDIELVNTAPPTVGDASVTVDAGVIAEVDGGVVETGAGKGGCAMDAGPTPANAMTLALLGIFAAMWFRNQKRRA